MRSSWWARAGLTAALFLVAAGCDDAGDENPVDMMASGPDSTLLVDAETPEPEADMAVDEDMAVADMAIEADMGPMGPECDQMANLGFEDFPTAVADTLGFTPRAVFTGAEFGVVWQTPRAEDNLNTVWFQRFDRDGAAQGDPAEIGVAAVPQHAVAFDGMNYVVAWLAARTVDSTFDGVRIRAVNADGTPSAAPPVDVQNSFDAEAIAFNWAQFGGGMLLYNRGRGGEMGIFANSVDPAFTVSPQIRLTDSPSQSPAVVFGDGAWGAAWLARDGEEPNELAFVLLDDQAQILGNEARVQGGGIGNVRMAYGQGIYGVAWTKLFGAGLPQAALTLVDGGGDPFATPPLSGPEGVATVTEVAFLAPDRFAIAWQENRPEGTRVGVSRITAQGLMTEPAVLAAPEGSARLGMTVGGTNTRISAWFTEDPDPQPVGYSESARVVTGVLAPCN